MNNLDLNEVHKRLREINVILGELAEIPEETNNELQEEIDKLVEKWNQLTAGAKRKYGK